MLLGTPCKIQKWFMFPSPFFFFDFGVVWSKNAFFFFFLFKKFLIGSRKTLERNWLTWLSLETQRYFFFMEEMWKVCAIEMEKKLETGVGTFKLFHVQVQSKQNANISHYIRTYVCHVWDLILTIGIFFRQVWLLRNSARHETLITILQLYNYSCTIGYTIFGKLWNFCHKHL